MATNKRNKTNPNAAKNIEIGDDLQITKTTRRAAGSGTWVIGTLNGHKFNALVFPAHAECPDYDLGDSRISKLWIEQIANKRVVVNFDRGWDVYPQTKSATNASNNNPRPFVGLSSSPPQQSPGIANAIGT
jgi:hypothetical protein